MAQSSRPVSYSSSPRPSGLSFSPVGAPLPPPRPQYPPPTPPLEQASAKALAGSLDPTHSIIAAAAARPAPAPIKSVAYLFSVVVEPGSTYCEQHQHEPQQCNCAEQQPRDTAQSESGAALLDPGDRAGRYNIEASGSWDALRPRVPVAGAPTLSGWSPVSHDVAQSHHRAVLSAGTSPAHQAAAPVLEIEARGQDAQSHSVDLPDRAIPSITFTSMDKPGTHDIYDLPVFGPDLPKNWAAIEALTKQAEVTHSQIANAAPQDGDLPVFGPDLPKNWAAMVRQHERDKLREQQKESASFSPPSEQPSPLFSFKARPESPASYLDISPDESPSSLQRANIVPAPQKAPPPLPPKEIIPPAEHSRPNGYTQPAVSHIPPTAQAPQMNMARSHSSESIPTGPAPAYSYYPPAYHTSSSHSFGQTANPVPQRIPIPQRGNQVLPPVPIKTPPSYPSQHLHPHQSPNLSQGSFSPQSESRSSLDVGAQSRSRSRSPSGVSKRQSWFGLGRTNSQPVTPVEPPNNSLAWFNTQDGRREYDLKPLLIGHRALELWDANGDTSVYIFPPERRMGPSFKIDSEMLEASPLKNLLIKKDGSSTTSPVVDFRGSYFQSAPKQEYRLLFPTPLGYGNPNSPPVAYGFNGDDIEAIIATRNFFAFLNRQPLLSSRRNTNFFGIMLAIARFLDVHKFSNIDGSTYGTAIMQNITYFVDALGLADVRESRQKTIESLILGEKLKCWPLYNEAFAHAVGKYDDIVKLNSPSMNLVGELTQRWLERSAIDLSRRLRSLNDRVRTFDFPSLFAGVAARSDEQKMVRFNKWKSSFNSTKNWFSGYYKAKYGSWPPKASSKKNSFEEGGLNRLLMQEVYNDLSNLYDMLVDRTDLTPRDVANQAEAQPEEMMGNDHKTLRKLLDEFDKSDVPVCPPIPFDAPLRPNLQLSYNNLNADSSGLNNRKLSPEEVHQAIVNAHNYDVDPSPFVDSFKAFERKEGHNKSLLSLIDQRNGQWIFIYVMLQCLPLVVIDAPNLRFSEGAEYFLCQHPINGPSWTATKEIKRSWYNVGNGDALAHLPSHVVEHGVDGIFQRSHCWVAGQKWIEAANMDEDEGLRLQMERVGLSPSPRPHAHGQEHAPGQVPSHGQSGTGRTYPVPVGSVPGFTVTGPGNSLAAGSQNTGNHLLPPHYVRHHPPPQPPQPQYQHQQHFGQYQRPSP